MKTRRKNRSYIVREEILPEAILKTVQATEMLAKGEALTVNDAVERVGLSRSAFYKYRDGVVPNDGEDTDNVTAIMLILEHRAGVLSNVLNTIAAMKGNIESINQSVPVRGVAVATLNVDTRLVNDMGLLVGSLQGQEGVKKVEVVEKG